ncbi:sulfurtransferase [Rhodobacterales bacterium 52_120_T64]|nr:sulfurtransferase [Rhodobacterales bacterium 52_120_T64]
MPIWKRRLRVLIPAVMLLAAPVQAQDVWITPDLPFFEFEAGGEFYSIERDQDSEARIVDAFAKTSRACPPFCIQPMVVAEGVQTVGEVELLDFIQDHVEPGDGFLVDARVESFFLAGTIPGAVNLPFNMFVASSANPFLDQLLILLGGKLDADGDWNFDVAAKLMVFCNGPWCAQSPRAINNLLELGYPAERLYYYRGGMQAWASLGLSVAVPG